MADFSDLPPETQVAIAAIEAAGQLGEIEEMRLMGSYWMRTTRDDEFLTASDKEIRAWLTPIMSRFLLELFAHPERLNPDLIQAYWEGAMGRIDRRLGELDK